MRLPIVIPFAAVLLLTFTARADSFSFEFSGASYSGSGILTATGNRVSGEYLVTDIAGSVNNLAITSLLVPGTYPPDVPNDNFLFFPTSPDSSYFDDSGISFELSDGTDINVYYGTYAAGGTVLGPQYILVEGDDETPSALDSLSVSISDSTSAVTPEPSTLTLLAIGVVSSATLRMRLRKQWFAKS